MAMNEIGNVKGIRGTSMALNNQSGAGTQKPSAMGGKADPGGTKPPMDSDKSVEIAK
jgi:hypothetical protein